MDFTKLPENVQNCIQKNVGIIVKTFYPETREYNDIICATTGGINFSDAITYSDWGEDIDGCKKNTKELKRIESREIKLSGTAVSATKENIKRLIGAADIDGLRIIPRDEVKGSDFETLWHVCDYGVGGFIAIKIYNALNTAGFSLQTTDNGKGTEPFEFTAHSSVNDDKVPYEVYVEDEENENPEVVLNRHSVTIAKDSDYTLTATTIPSGSLVTWSSSDSTKASVAGGVVTGEAVGSAIITASITENGVTYTDTCTVVVEA